MANSPLTLTEFIDICYSGLKAKFDLSTTEEKETIMAQFNKTLPGLGDALNGDRKDLDLVISGA